MKDLDCRGLACPQPVIRCREAVAAGAAALSVKVDNLAARENVLRYLGNNGFTCTCEEKDGIFHIRATRTGSTTATAPETGGDDAGARTLVLITTPTLGRGDDTLGQRLMETFLGTLPEMRNLWRVVLLNGGVRLSATPGPALDALKKLAESGVSILVCGTCLAHYGLAEAKEVGETSNMLDIVSSLDLAEKVIRP